MLTHKDEPALILGSRLYTADIDSAIDSFLTLISGNVTITGSVSFVNRELRAFSILGLIQGAGLEQ